MLAAGDLSALQPAAAPVTFLRRFWEMAVVVLTLSVGARGSAADTAAALRLL